MTLPSTSPPRERPPAVNRRPDISVAAKNDPSVPELLDHLQQMQRRVVAEAILSARRSFWLRRAENFRAALPRQTDWHGSEGLASVRARRDRLKAIIAACESAAEIALWQDGEPNV